MQRAKIMIRISSSFLFAYLLGAIPFAYLLGLGIKGIDIRKSGSCNTGATNLMRLAGRPLGIIALCLDILKGAASVTVLADTFFSPSVLPDLYVYKVLLGVCAVTGHTWPVYLKFKGGKGVAVTIGVLIGLAPIVIVSSLLIWCFFVFIFKYVSLGSIAMAISLPLFMIIYNQPMIYVLLCVALCVLIIFRHRSNIARIIQGREYKIGQKIK
jgi:acyl phosphate:glycerol-3-phosphate acyltransferase